MMKKYILFLIVQCTILKVSHANMASPYQVNDKMASILTSRDVDILSEKINITINKEFTQAQFHVIYQISSNQIGKTIPLLFYAKRLSNDFHVFVDTQPIEVFNEIPERYYQSINTEQDGKVYINWSGDYEECLLSELKFFEITITKHIHTVEIIYQANVSEDHSDLIKRYYFTYSLSPAKYWKSFGSLEILLNIENHENISTNLGIPVEGKITSPITTWKFDSIPSDYIEISYFPKLSWAAKIIRKIGIFNIILISQIFWTILFSYLVFNYRKHHVYAKHNKYVYWGVAISSLIFPLNIWLLSIIVNKFLGEAISKNAFYGWTILGFAYLLWGIFIIVAIIHFIWYKLIDWKVENPVVSEKDLQLQKFCNFQTQFTI